MNQSGSLRAYLFLQCLDVWDLDVRGVHKVRVLYQFDMRVKFICRLLISELTLPYHCAECHHCMLTESRNCSDGYL